MAKVTFVGEPNYDLIEKAVRQFYASLTPEQRAKYAHKVEHEDGEEKVSESQAAQQDGELSMTQ